ncbi:MAG TPA: uracil-DNA glycosylase, partial [Octadecabacter sp.]|nr:uracil-DNA glycosylase [Octadecabacter sp.]
LDKMLAAIGLGRSGDAPVYMAPVIPWNPPQNRDPNAAELAMMQPFLERHIALAAPKVLILMGNGPCHAMIKKSGMTRLRGGWTEAAGVPAIPMFAPSYLLTNPAAKRDAWADLLSLKARLKDLT